MKQNIMDRRRLLKRLGLLAGAAYVTPIVMGIIPACTNQNRCAQSRIPMDIIFHGRSMRLFQASQDRVTISS